MLVKIWRPLIYTIELIVEPSLNPRHQVVNIALLYVCMFLLHLLLCYSKFMHELYNYSI